MKKIPTDVDNFVTLREEGYYFFDKTGYIRLLERQKKFILLVRPRRMGKTLFSSMLMAYYDINLKDRFQELFGDLEIGKQPTEWASKYMSLRLDFSQVSYHPEELEKNFTSYCMIKFKEFLLRYHEYFTEKESNDILNSGDIKSVINRLVDIAHLKKMKIFLVIDEYDNFTNTVLAARGVKAHEAITHGEGFYRTFFSGCKGTFDRIFLTGVSPVTYDDLTSGFNIADVVSLEDWFNSAMGVTETELKDMIEYYRSKGTITRRTEDIIAEMKPWYDNFCFCDSCYGIEPPIYNTQMVLRYMQNLVEKGRPPKVLLDRSARVDTRKLNFLVMSEDLGDRSYRINIIKEIISQGYITGNVEEQFPAGTAGETKNFKSMLFYYGTLTFGDRDEYGLRKLVVTNKTMRDLYLNYMHTIVEEEGFILRERVDILEQTVSGAAVKGEWLPMVEEMGKLCHQYSSIRNNSEPQEQAFLRGLLCQNPYYDVWPELELGDGYCDILMVPRTVHDNPAKFSYLIELKHMSARAKDPEAKVKEACKQLQQYIAEAHLADSPLLGGTTLIPIYMVFDHRHRLVAKGKLI